MTPSWQAVLAIGGSYYPIFHSVIYAMKTLAQNVRGIQVSNSGHWIPEKPGVIIKILSVSLEVFNRFNIRL
jgi:hypothetical protein